MSADVAAYLRQRHAAELSHLRAIVGIGYGYSPTRDPVTCDEIVAGRIARFGRERASLQAAVARLLLLEEVAAELGVTLPARPRRENG